MTLEYMDIQRIDIHVYRNSMTVHSNHMYNFLHECIILHMPQRAIIRQSSIPAVV